MPRKDNLANVILKNSNELAKLLLLCIWLLFSLIYFGIIESTFLVNIHIFVAAFIFIFILILIYVFDASFYLKSCYLVLTIFTTIIYSYIIYIINSSKFIYGSLEKGAPYNITCILDVNYELESDYEKFLSFNLNVLLEARETVNTTATELLDYQKFHFVPSEHITESQFVLFKLQDHIFEYIGLFLFTLLIIFNIHYILSLKNYYLPAFSRDLNEIYHTKIRLNDFNLIIIMILILSPLFLFHYYSKGQGIYNQYMIYLCEDMASIASFTEYFLLNYLLTLIFLLTLSVHVWLNISIVYTFYMILIRKNCIDLRDRKKYRLLRRFTSFLSMTSYRYFLLLILLVLAYIKIRDDYPQNIDGHFVYYVLSSFNELEPYVLSILFLVLITINLTLFLHIFFISRDFAHARYGRLYKNYHNNIDDDLIKIKKIVEPFSPKNHIMIFISLLTSIIYLMIPIIQMFILIMDH